MTDDFADCGLEQWQSYRGRQRVGDTETSELEEIGLFVGMLPRTPLMKILYYLLSQLNISHIQPVLTDDDTKKHSPRQCVRRYMSWLSTKS